MSELIRDKQKRKDLLKHMIKQLHAGEAPDAVRKQLVKMLGQVPYDEVVEVEQELISEGLHDETRGLLKTAIAALAAAAPRSAASGAEFCLSALRCARR